MTKLIQNRLYRGALQVLSLAMIAFMVSSCSLSINTPDDESSKGDDSSVSDDGFLDGPLGSDSTGEPGADENVGVEKPRDSSGTSGSPSDRQVLIDLPQAPTAQPGQPPPTRGDAQTTPTEQLPQQGPTNNTDDQYPEDANREDTGSVDSATQQVQTEEFINWVATELDGFWSDMYAQAGEQYYTPNFQIVYEPEMDVCGIHYEPNVMGPIYCSNSTIYIPPYALLGPAGTQKTMEEYGDFALASTIAHEWGHHLQNMPMAQGQTFLDVDDGKELQADCFAGVWAHSTYYKGQLEPGDREEAISLLRNIADDAYGTPDEQGTHGSSQSREDSFVYGYNTGDASQCVT